MEPDETPVKLESYLFAGAYAEDLSDGRMVFPGSAPVDVDPSDPHHAAMIERGTLIPYIGATFKPVEQAQEDNPSTPEQTESVPPSKPTDTRAQGGKGSKNRTTSQEEQR